jgi:predicted ATPase/DNA-binding SARP family transcriptional activator/class 3 adenylate cyclase
VTTRRQICLLGSFLATLDGEPVSQFGSDSARALLAYLALHPGMPLRRDKLAGLLWPEQTDAQARRNLRVALSRLRAAIGDRDAGRTQADVREPDEPLLQVERQTILFPDDARCFVDVSAMRDALAETRTHAHERLERCGECAERLRKATALYQGEFLAGFTLDSVPFEEWMVVEREALHWQALEALAALAGYYEGQGNYERAIENARRQVELESWRESAHRQCIRCLALSGHRGAALAQYEACRQILAEELGVEPEPETQALQASIRSGALAPAAPAPSPVEAPTWKEPPPAPEPPSVPAPPLPGRPVALPEGERRVVTALSVGFVGGATTEERSDPELWAEAVGHALGRALTVVERYGGEVSQVRESGLVVLFGAVAAHEDDPERAVLAALEIAHAPAEGALCVRAGVHTGEAIVPRVGDGRLPQVATALGNVVPAAGQIERAAEPGTVLVDEGTYGLARTFFEWERAGEAGAAPLYRPLARTTKEDALRGKGRGIEGLESPLVGRDAEVRALHQALEGLRAGLGGIVTLVGDAGIGKSRLVAEIRNTVRQPADLRSDPKSPTDLQSGLKSANLTWLEGRCLSYTETEAYRLWGDVLRALLAVSVPISGPADTDAGTMVTAVRDALRDRVRALCGEGAAEVYPLLARMLALPLEEEAEARLRGLDGQSLRTLTFRAWETLLECVANQRPLVLVGEDLHWADPTSLALLEHLLPLAERLPLLVVCVFRPLTDHGCWQIREVAAREFRHLHTDLWLEALTEGQSVELVGHLLRVEDLPSALRSHILEHAEGNPFYVEEILRSLIDAAAGGGAGIVHDEESGRWHASMDLTDLPLPDTLRGVLTARIDRLPLAARHVLRLASVVGRIFQRHVLESLVQNTSELDSHLRALQRAQMIRRRPDLPQAAYIFKHQLTQEAAYESLLRRKRRDLHRRVALTLEQLYSERVEGQMGLLAHHWERAGDVERAVSYLQRAGEQAAAQFANPEAAAYLDRALGLTPEDDWEGRYTLLSLREEVHNVQGEREAQARDLAALQELALLLGDLHQAEVAVRRAHHAVMATDYDAAIAAAREAVRLGEATGYALSQAAGHRHWGRAFRRQGMYEEARAHYERALALARGAGLHAEEAYNIRQLGLTCVDDYVKACTYREQALLLFRQIGDRRGEGMSLRDLGIALMFQGKADQAQHYLEQSLQVCRETGDRRDEGWALFFLGHCSWFQGDVVAAEDYYARSLPLMHDTDPMGETNALLYSGWIYLQVGDYARAQGFLERTLHAGRESIPGLEGALLACLAWVSAHLGDKEGAQAYARQAQPVLQDKKKRFSSTIALLGHALFLLGRPAEAADVYLQATASPQTTIDLAWSREILAGRARVHLAQGEPGAALACVEEILDQMETDPIFHFTLEPLRLYLTCYRVLCANEDPRAGPVLQAAYDLLQEQAAKFDNPALRRSFLENVAAHREIVALYSASPDAKPSG